MTRTKTISALWEEFETFIAQAHQLNKGKESDALRDYAPNVSWHNELADLVEREAKNEKHHRNGNDRHPKDFSSVTASKLILMQKAADGAVMTGCPLALDFLIYRREAIEAQVIGWLCRETISAEWRKAVEAFDYAKVMQEAA